MIKRNFLSQVFLSLAGLCIMVHCHESTDPKVSKSSVFQFFHKSEIVDISLVSSFDTLLRNKETEKYQPAILHYSWKEEQQQKMEIQISTRGNTRKTYCTFPPLRLKFDKKKLVRADLAKYKTLKLVVPCKAGKSYEELVLKEYLCYKLFQIITHNSFQVQLVNLTLEGNQGQRVLKNYGFLIEHEDEMADRLHGKMLELVKSNLLIDNGAYNVVALFQFMIGNSDWNIKRMHNIKLIERNGENHYLAVPYDFDNSGLVNAEYARPHPNLPIENVRQRTFQWRGKDHEDILTTVQIFLGAKETILQTVSSFTPLPKATREDMLDYLHGFYELVEAQDPLKRILN